MTSDLRDRPTGPASDAGTSTDTDRARGFEFSPHNCFACGTLNTNGLQLVLHLGERRSWTALELDRRFEGWEGMAHGGIVSAILDEVMAWALVAEDNWGVTARLQVRFRRPVPIGQVIRAEGWITESHRRVIDTEARLTDASDGTELATATATYVAADEARKTELRERYGFRRLDTATPEPVVKP